VLTAESQAVSSRTGVESRSHFRLIAVYVQLCSKAVHQACPLSEYLPSVKRIERNLETFRNREILQEDVNAN
jgi:hypothetical protein